MTLVKCVNVKENAVRGWKCNNPKKSFAIITLPFPNATETHSQIESQRTDILNPN